MLVFIGEQSESSVGKWLKKLVLPRKPVFGLNELLRLLRKQGNGLLETSMVAARSVNDEERTAAMSNGMKTGYTHDLHSS